MTEVQPSPFRLEVAWQREELRLESAALAFWRKHRLLPRDAYERGRAKQLCVVAFAGDDEEVAGLSTVVIRLAPQLRANLAFFRCAVAPTHRRLGCATQIAIATRDAMEAWARGHPEHELKGLCAIVQGDDLAAKKEQPEWPATHLNLTGYNQRGEQLRVAWFRDAKVL